MDSSANHSEMGATTPHASPTAAAATLTGGSVVTAAVADRVQVVAPASLPGGYELHCEFQGRPVVVQVPPEGVKQGQQFVADVIRRGDAEASGHRIPTGKWRDGICDCFANGLCHPTLWLACCCRPLAIGQILTRMGLTATGNAIPPEAAPAPGRASAFKVVACIFAVYLVVDFALALMWFPQRAQMTPFSSFARFVNFMVEIAFGIYMLVLLIRTRGHVRRRYSIPGDGCEDCCCSFWLPCCTTLQVARHTADYEQYPASCCTATGLSPHAPEIV